MKYALLLLTLLGAVSPAAAQTQLKLPRQRGWVNPLPIDSTTGKVSFRAVVQVPGATQAQLYTRAKEWFAAATGPVKPTLSQANETSGTLSGKASELVMQNLLGANVQVPLWRTVTIQVKPGRFRYILTDFAFDSGQGQGAITPIENYLTPNALTFDANGYPRPVLQSTIDAIYRSGRQQASSIRQRVSGKAADDNW
jgi:hypothetical protein